MIGGQALAGSRVTPITVIAAETAMPRMKIGVPRGARKDRAQSGRLLRRRSAERQPRKYTAPAATTDSEYVYWTQFVLVNAAKKMPKPSTTRFAMYGWPWRFVRMNHGGSWRSCEAP